MKYTIQLAPEDCTGCRLCVDVCPARDKTTGVLALEMAPQPPLRQAERMNYEFFLNLPEVDRRTVKTVQRQRVSVPAAALRILRGMRRMRRNAVPEAGVSVIRRPHDRGQRDRLLIDLRR